MFDWLYMYIVYSLVQRCLNPIKTLQLLVTGCNILGADCLELREVFIVQNIMARVHGLHSLIRETATLSRFLRRARDLMTYSNCTLTVHKICLLCL